MERSRLTADVTLPREPKQERSRRKQEALLDAAAELFTSPGFEHVTADEIAARAGYGTGTFYNYFTNKTQVFLMVAGQHETAITPTLEPVVNAISAGVSLHMVVKGIMAAVIADRQQVPWLRRTWLRLALTDPDVDAVQVRIDAEWDAAIATVVARLVSAGTAQMPAGGSSAAATVIRILVDATADEVVLRRELDANMAAQTVADFVTGLLRTT